MGTTYEMRPGTLRGMGREVACIVGMIIGNYSHDSRLSIQNAPPDMPEGEYVFTYKHGAIFFNRYQGIWLEKVR